MIKKIMDIFENKLSEECVDIPITLKIEIGDSKQVPPIVISQPEGQDVEPTLIATPTGEPSPSAESEEDAKVLARIDDYFKTLNDGQYSPLSGEHNNASNSTEVYHIAKKHNVDPAKLMAFLGDTAIFDKFKELAHDDDKKAKFYADPALQNNMARMIRPDVYKDQLQKTAAEYLAGVMRGNKPTITSLATANNLHYTDLLSEIETLRANKQCHGTAISERKKGSAKKDIKKGKNKALNAKTKDIAGNPVAKHDRNRPSVIPNSKPYDRADNKKLVLDDISVVASKHGVKESTVISILRNGIREEMRITTDKSSARRAAMNNINNNLDYYAQRRVFTTESIKGMEGPYRDKMGMKFYWDLRKGAYYYPHDKHYVTSADSIKALKPYTLQPIDPEKFPNREYEGLEGPYRNSNGFVYYYDLKVGKYYDSRRDVYLEPSEVVESKCSILDSTTQLFERITEGKKMSNYEAELLRVLDELNIDYAIGTGGEIIVDDPWYSQLLKVYPKYTGILQRHEFCLENCAGAIATVAVPIGGTIKRTNEAGNC